MKFALARSVSGLFLLIAVGCGGPAGPEMVTVKGSVTIGSKPLPRGDILFQPTDPKLTPSGGAITDGAYSVKAVKGDHQVKITASREVPGKTTMGVSGTPIPVIEQYIPAKYNTKTELKASVSKDPTVADFGVDE